MQSKVILFDIDYTLFDQGKYRQLVFDTFQKLLPHVPHVAATAMEAYEEIRKSGWFEIEKFTQVFMQKIPSGIYKDVLMNVWKNQELLDKAVYPEAVEVLEKLQQKFALGIFSSGNTDFQKSKITKITHFFEEQHIHIHELKDEEISNIAKKYTGQKMYIVDDYIPVIEKAKKTDPSITTIWIKRGRLSERVAPSQEFPPDYTISNLIELLPILMPEKN